MIIIVVQLKKNMYPAKRTYYNMCAPDEILNKIVFAV